MAEQIEILGKDLLKFVTLSLIKANLKFFKLCHYQYQIICTYIYIKYLFHFLTIYNICKICLMTRFFKNKNKSWSQ